MRRLAALALLPLIAAQAPAPAPAPTATPAPTPALAPAKPKTPNDVVAAAPAESWRTMPAEDLLVMTLEGGAQVVIQLAPGFAPVHVANIRKMAQGNYWQGSGIYRVQDNYVAQWGLGEAERALPAGVVKRPPHEYWRSAEGLDLVPLDGRDSYARATGFSDGWPVAVYADGNASLTHCYGYVGVARDLAPDTGSGSELYAIIGHAPRQLDRNIAIVGRVISGIDKLSSLPRGTENLGFYAKDVAPKPIQSVQLAANMPTATRPSFQFLDTKSKDFAAYANLRANRNDDFYRVAAGGVDLCNVSVPVRPTPTK